MNVHAFFSENFAAEYLRYIINYRNQLSHFLSGGITEKSTLDHNLNLKMVHYVRFSKSEVFEIECELERLDAQICSFNNYLRPASVVYSFNFERVENFDIDHHLIKSHEA
jgi:hypothetical protein